MDSFWGLFALMLAAAFVGATVGGLIVAGILEGRLTRRLDSMTRHTDLQLADVTDHVTNQVSDAVRDIVERVDSAAAEQHDQTRRILEQRNEYTGSYEMPLPTVAEVQRFAETSTDRTPPSGVPAPAPRPSPWPAPAGYPRAQGPRQGQVIDPAVLLDRFRADQERAAHRPVPDQVDRAPDRAPRHGQRTQHDPRGI